jgi:L-alanine-DL-glutamate epimerase-like enolase superfamily enzyme
MRIAAIRETTVSVAAAMRNADIAFDQMTASAVAVVSDRVRRGEPVVGFGFDSIGRYAHGGLMRERFIPRLEAAAPDALLDGAGLIDPVRAWAAMMAGEKGGGHGDRGGAVGVLDMALWDLRAKLLDRPAWRVIADRFGRPGDPRVFAYASGGHYRDRGDGGADDRAALADEVRAAVDRGFTQFKVKVGGAPLDADRRRIDAALGALGPGCRLAVDANTAFDRTGALAFFDAVAGLGLAWVEEPVAPLDYALYAELAAATRVPLATGENLMSFDDTRNLLRYAGLRPDRDMIQVDIGLAYGLPEYARIVDLLDDGGTERGDGGGWSPRRLYPHAGHLLSLHAAAGFGLGGWETALDPDLVISGVPEGCAVEDGCVRPPEAPGFGFETMPRLAAILVDLVA